ncbi:MAG: WG repeat-containing protein [Bacteroidia bacterium]|nr:WG repeat-containing protein [Bacteroidia bacterium]
MSDKNQHITPFFPFQGFITHLRHNGFTVGIHTYMKVQELLNHLDRRVSVDELKTLLCPIFASNPEEQSRFIYLFDNYFASFEDIDPHQFPEADINQSSTTGKPKNTILSSPKTIGIIIAGTSVMIFIIAFLAFLWYGYRQYQDADSYYLANNIEPTFYKRHTYAFRKVFEQPQPCDSLIPDFSYKVEKNPNDTYTLILKNRSKGKASGCSWKFNNDSTEDKRWDISKQNIEKGSHSVKLTVRNKFGCSKSLTLDIQFGVETESPVLIADYNYKINGLTVSFSDSTFLLKGEVKRRKWNFGDNTPEIRDAQNPTHKYTKEGRYTVSLEVSDGHFANTVFKDILIVLDTGRNAVPAHRPSFNSFGLIKYGKNPRELRLLLRDIRKFPVVIPLVLILIGPFFWFLYRRRKRDYLIGKEPNTNPPFIWNISLDKTFHFHNIIEWNKTATQLRKREDGEKNKLDIQATLRQTIEQGGFINFQYKAEQRPVEYLFLIDRATFKDHQAIFYQLMTEKLSKEDIYIEVYFYNHHFRYFWKTFEETPVYLEEVIAKCPNHKLVIIGDGDGLLDPSTGEIAEGADLLIQSYPHRAFMSTVSTADWGRKENILENRFVVLPAKLSGFNVMADRSQRKGSYRISQWIDGEDNPMPDFTLEVGIDEIRTYLGNDVFRWFAACAIYPELYWGLTLHLGEYLSERFHAGQSKPGEGNYFLLSENLLLRLIRLPYFRKGVIPEALRPKLIEYLGEDLCDDIRKVIVKMLEENMPPAGSMIADKLKMNIVLQKWQMKGEKSPEIREDLQAYLERNEIQDYVVLEKLKKGPRTNKSTEKKWQSIIRNILFREGIPMRGVNARVVMAICGIIFAIGCFSLWKSLPSGNFSFTDKGTKYYLLTKEDSISFYSYRANRLFNGGSYGSAVNDLNNAIMKDPFVPELYYNRGVAKFFMFKERQNPDDYDKLNEAIIDFRFAAVMIPSYTPETKINETHYYESPKTSLFSVIAENGSVMASLNRNREVVISGLTGEKPLPVKQNFLLSSVPKSIDIDAAGNYLAAGLEDFSAVIIDLNRKNIERSFTGGHKGAVTSIALSHDNKYLATGSTDKKVIIWNIQTQKPVLKLEKHNAKITSLRFSNDDTKLISASEDKTAIIWDRESGRPLQLLEPNDDVIIYSEFGTEGALSFTVSDMGVMKIWNEQGLYYSFASGDKRCTAASLFPEKNMIAMAGDDGILKVFNLKGEVIKSLNVANLINEKNSAVANNTLKINNISFSVNGEWLLIATNSGNLLCNIDLKTTRRVSDVMSYTRIMTDSVNQYNNLPLLSINGSTDIDDLWMKNVLIPYNLGLMYYESAQFEKAYTILSPIPQLVNENKKDSALIQETARKANVDSTAKTILLAKNASAMVYSYQNHDKDLLKNTFSDLIFLFSRTPSDKLLTQNQQYQWVKCIDQTTARFQKNEVADTSLYEKSCIVQNLIYKNYCSLKSKYEAIGIPGEGYTPFKSKGLWGYLNENLEEYIPAIYKEATSFRSGYARVTLNTKNLSYAYINKNGEVKYDAVGGISEGRIPVRENGLWGYIDMNHKVVMKPSYQSAGTFINGFAIVSQNNLYGYVDYQGKAIIPPKYREAQAFSENGVAQVTLDDNQTIFIDQSGNEIKLTAIGGEKAIPDDPQAFRDADMAKKSVNAKKSDGSKTQYDFAGEIREGYRLVKANGLFGFIDPAGKPLTGLLYQDAGEFNEGRAAVKLNNKWGFIDKNGLIVIPVIFSKVNTPFRNGKAEVVKDGKTIFIDEKGQCIDSDSNPCSGVITTIAPLVSQELKSRNDLIFKDNNEKWGMKDEKGNIIHKGIFDNMPQFIGGVARVKQGDKWGYIKINGKLLTGIKYQDAGDFASGLAPVKYDGKWGYVDLNGKEVIPFIYESASSFKDNKAKVTKDNKTFLINPQGGYEASDTGKKGGIIPDVKENIQQKIQPEKDPVPAKPAAKAKEKVSAKKNEVKQNLPPEIQKKMDYYQNNIKK